MSEFYENLRDNTAHRLLTKFGFTATYLSKPQVAMSNSGGTFTGADAETPIRVVRGKLPGKYDGYTEEQLALAAAKFTLSAKSFVDAGIQPKVNDRIKVGTELFTIETIKTTQPGNIAVIYEVLCSA